LTRRVLGNFAVKSDYEKVQTKKAACIDFPYQVRRGCIHSLRLLSNGFGVYRREYVEHLKGKILSGECRGVQAERVDCKRGLIFDANL
jgi:hypothetical protein